MIDEATRQRMRTYADRSVEESADAISTGAKFTLAFSFLAGVAVFFSSPAGRTQGA